MSAYIDIDYVRDQGILDPVDVDAFEAAYPGRIAKLCVSWSRYADSILAKRRATPVSAPVPEALKLNVCRLVTMQIAKQRGVVPGTDWSVFEKDEAAAQKWLADAADPEKGIVDLPLRESAVDESGIDRAGPLGYSEPDPFTWTDVQREAVRS
jgi:hypothetical protein